MQYIDISLPLSANSITYPNNPSVVFESQPTQSNTITKISFGSHSGTHIDAPSHALPGAKSIDKLSLDIFQGTARVIDCVTSKKSIEVEDLEAKKIRAGERLLIKTSNSIKGFSYFYPNFVYLAPSAAEYLASKKVMLVGIDSLSIKQKGNPDNTPHTALLEKNIPILEGLDLSKVKEGKYELTCFPLKFIGIDGSPVRAVLKK